MDIFFTDPTDVPLPPEDVRIRKFEIDPYPDGKRLRVSLELTPFLKKPSGEIVIFDALQNPVASVNIIETIDPKMQLTMHLRSPETAGSYRAQITLFYTAEFEAEPDQQDTEPLELPQKTVVDQAETSFQIVI